VLKGTDRMDISLYRTIPAEIGDSVFVNSVPLMNVISHEIEDVVVSNGLPVDFYVGFQRFSFFLRQLKRYQRLASVCRRVYVWGIPDVTPPSLPGIEFIPLTPQMELAREWFLVVNTPGFFSALLTREVTYGQDLPKGARRFRGVWTYDPMLVDRAFLLVSQMLGQSYRPVIERSYEDQSRYIGQISNRLVKRQDQIDQALARVALMQHGIAQGTTALIVCDSQFRVIVASDRAAQVLQQEAALLSGQLIDEVANGVFAELDLAAPETVIVSRLRDEHGAPVRANSVSVPNKYGDAIGYLVTLHFGNPALATASAEAPILQKYLIGMQQLLTMMPSLVGRHDVQHRVISQLQRMVTEMHAHVTQTPPSEQIDGIAQQLPPTNDSTRPPW
jgi:DICT domain-containing protein